MRLVIATVLSMTVAGCAYVTKAEFDEYLDADGDGWTLAEDCNDEDNRIYPSAPDVRGDGCDADCGHEPDADGDDWPDQADCDPDDDTVFPCSPFEEPDDDIDSDCDGSTEARTDDCSAADPDDPDNDETIDDCGGGGS